MLPMLEGLMVPVNWVVYVSMLLLTAMKPLANANPLVRASTPALTLVRLVGIPNELPTPKLLTGDTTPSSVWAVGLQYPLHPTKAKLVLPAAGPPNVSR